jgi:UDP-glucose 4-epimerase
VVDAKGDHSDILFEILMRVMVTGGAGFIGSHTCVELIRAGHAVVIFDNFSNSRRTVVDRIGRIVGRAPPVVEGDVRDRAALASCMDEFQCEAVIHFAGLKSVAESVATPRSYYDHNVVGSLRVIEAMKDTGVQRLVFSSSATVYGEPQMLPLRESHPLVPTNPYGRTKLIVEQALGDIARSSPQIRLAILRYFNPVGSHDSGLLGEQSMGEPANLMPIVTRVAAGKTPALRVFGNDYDTVDGTCVRDYVHVMDLAAGHVCTLERLDERQSLTINLGTGHGTSVLELVETFSRVNGCTIPTEFAPRRLGDAASSYANCDLAQELLGWRAERGLADMCRDAWRWELALAESKSDSK